MTRVNKSAQGGGHQDGCARHRRRHAECRLGVLALGRLSLVWLLAVGWLPLVPSIMRAADGEPSATAATPATETPTQTETPVPSATGTPTPSATAQIPSATATPSATFTGTPPTPTTPPSPHMSFLFIAAQGQTPCAFGLALQLGLTNNGSMTLQLIATKDPMWLRNVYQVIYVSPGLGADDYVALSALVASGGVIEKFVSSGGVLVVNAAGTAAEQTNVAPGAVGISGITTHEAETISLQTHPYVTGVGYGGEPLSSSSFDNWQHTDAGTLTNLPDGAKMVLANSDGPSWAEYRHGDGRVIVSSIAFCTPSEPSSQLAPARNLLRYSSFFSGSAFTPAPTVTMTPPASATNTATGTRLPTRTPTRTATFTSTATRTSTHTPPPSLTPTSTRTATATRTTAMTPTSTSSVTPTATASLTPTATASVTATPTPSASASATRTSSYTVIPTATATPSATATDTPTPSPTATSTPPPPTATPTPVCPGDCDADGIVRIDEVMTLVNIALGGLDPDACVLGDRNRDGHITVDEILIGVSSALNGCP